MSDRCCVVLGASVWSGVVKFFAIVIIYKYFMVEKIDSKKHNNNNNKC